MPGHEIPLRLDQGNVMTSLAILPSILINSTTATGDGAAVQEA